ncbi:hypothetical protein [Mesorhizobium shangrilense]|uniref:Uncharacterized protein n=1 Tax=Mesorhizobium shangrilense TaxID=460060 RepID=A0ABV2DBF6_9HYPH
MVQVGDIVVLGTGLRYAVLEFLGNASGGQDVRLIRRNADGTYSSFQKSAEFLVPAETPVFEPGDEVTIDGFKGTYMSREADGDVARVMLEPRRRQLSGGGFVQIEAGIARASFALLVLQNRKVT